MAQAEPMIQPRVCLADDADELETTMAARAFERLVLARARFEASVEAAEAEGVPIPEPDLDDATREVFSGCPEMKNGYLYANEAPGWGIEVDEAAAARFPFGHGEKGERQELNGGWGAIRRRDGTIIKQ